MKVVQRTLQLRLKYDTGNMYSYYICSDDEIVWSDFMEVTNLAFNGIHSQAVKLSSGNICIICECNCVLDNNAEHHREHLPVRDIYEFIPKRQFIEEEVKPVAETISVLESPVEAVLEVLIAIPAGAVYFTLLSATTTNVMCNGGSIL